jgi:hypothetical protein
MHGPLWRFDTGVPRDQYGTEIDPYNFVDKHKHIRNAAIIQSPDILERHGTDIVDGSPPFQEDFIESVLLTAQFLFTDIRFIEEVGNDSRILFLADEPTMSMRAWTRGYRIFAIKDVVFLHLDKSPSPELNWRMAYEIKRNPARESNALKRAKDIMTGNIIGYYGAPSIELLAEYDALFDYSLVKYFEENLYVSTN